jgi:hypothetical protein
VSFSVLAVKKADRNFGGLARRDSSCALKMKPHIKVLFVDYHQAIELSTGRRTTAPPGMGRKKIHRCGDVCELIHHVTPLTDLSHCPRISFY